MKRILLIAVVGLVSLASCKKDKKENPTVPGDVKSFNDLKVGPNFDWATEKTIELEIQAFQTPFASAKGTLEVKLPDGRTIHKRLHQMNQSAKVNLTIPAFVNNLNISYGTVVKDVAINGMKAQFLPVETIIENED
jgi:hypothetical protein